MNLVDYHIHTELCGHASGSIVDYICEAININLKEIGFADHAPLPKGLREGMTMLPDQTECYINRIEEARKKYKDKIKVKIGFEVDFPLMNTFNRKYLIDPRLDYLVGSCHSLDNWVFDHPNNLEGFDNRDIDDIYSEYYRVIKSMVLSGYFNIIGHFDLVKKFGHRSKLDFTKTIENISAIIANKNIAVEINTAGLRKPVGEIYPSDDIIKIFYRMNTPITLGSDSHKPDEVGYCYSKALEKIKGAGYRKISGFSKRHRYDIEI